jgi:hypothetical protein
MRRRKIGIQLPVSFNYDTYDTNIDAVGGDRFRKLLLSTIVSPLSYD